MARKSCDFDPFRNQKSMAARSRKASATPGGTQTWFGTVFSAGRGLAAIGPFLEPRVAGAPLAPARAGHRAAAARSRAIAARTRSRIERASSSACSLRLGYGVSLSALPLSWAVP